MKIKNADTGSKEINTISNTDIYYIYKDLYLIEKGHEEKLLQIHSINYLKARVGAKKADSTIIKVQKRGNAIRKTLGKKFETPLDHTSCISLCTRRELDFKALNKFF